MVEQLIFSVEKCHFSGDILLRELCTTPWKNHEIALSTTCPQVVNTFKKVVPTISPFSNFHSSSISRYIAQMNPLLLWSYIGLMLVAGVVMLVNEPATASNSIIPPGHHCVAYVSD